MDLAIGYKDRDNTFWVELKRNGVLLTAVEMAAITKFEIKYEGVYYDSVTTPLGFVVDAANGRVQIKPYELDLPIGLDNITEMIIYDAADNTHGLRWGAFSVSIRGDVTLPTTPSPTTMAPTTAP